MGLRGQMDLTAGRLGLPQGYLLDPQGPPMGPGYWDRPVGLGGQGC